MKKSIVLVSVIAALMGAPVANAESKAGPGACVAVVDNLGVPVVAQLESTDGSWINFGMTVMQAHAAGYSDFPWIIQPGGVAQVLEYRIGDYVVSKNGYFNVYLFPIKHPTDPRVAVPIWNPGDSHGIAPKYPWEFHPEMTYNGYCKGTWVVTVGQ